MEIVFCISTTTTSSRYTEINISTISITSRIFTRSIKQESLIVVFTITNPFTINLNFFNMRLVTTIFFTFMIKFIIYIINPFPPTEESCVIFSRTFTITNSVFITITVHERTRTFTLSSSMILSFYTTTMTPRVSGVRRITNTFIISRTICI